mmetsp:Transcript_94555/g.267121  ORF Transcript_94555/g.267121 Transcript_94555/m.267121 type:complete len:413 (-) Transcript_94555:45-1283(-)
MAASEGKWEGAWQRTTELRARRNTRPLALACVLPRMPRIGDEGLRAVETHQYRPGPITPLDRLLYKVWWEPLGQRLPAWLAPNAITLLGASGAMASGLLLWAFCPTIEGGAPRWAELLAGLLVLFYQTCDAVDGLQARRTGACSPLGELLDHGCDGTCLTAFTIGYCISQQCGLGVLTSSALVVSWLPWWLAQWEAYHTGIVRTGGEVFGITEIEFVVAFIHFVTAAVGPDVWKTPVLQLPGVLPGDGVLDLREVCICIQLVAALVLSALSVKYVLATVADARTAMVACARALPIFVLAGVTALWPLLVSDKQHGAPALLAACALFTRIASEIVLVHMTLEQYPKWQLALPLLPVVFLAGLLGLLDTALGGVALWAYAVFCVVDAAAYVVDSVQEISAHLGVSLYRIKPRID